MADTENPQQPTSASFHQPNWRVETINQTVVVQGGATPEEVTPERLAEIEARYRQQVIERYNRLGFAGLGLGDLRLSDVALDDVFVRLTLTVEKIVREPIPPEEWEREERSRNPTRRGEKKEDERPRERIITTEEPITLGDALAQHALIVGEPGAGKSTLLRWLAVTFADRKQQEADRLGPQADADRLPLLVELGRLPKEYLQANSDKPSWPELLPKEALRQGELVQQEKWKDIPAAFLAQALAAGRCLLLCDGLDEIADLSARRRLADSLADYARSSANRLVLSSRPSGVSGSEASLGARFQRLTIQRFAPEDVRRFFGFLCAQYEELTAQEQAKEADALYAAVQATPKTLELATTPLLATLLLLLWNENGYLPERRVELYERCCQMLIESWEAQHDVAYTGVLRDIGWERHLRLLAPLAYAIHNTGQRTDAPASELIPILAQAMQNEGLAAPASATLEAEKFLRTLSLRSGLLQFLGGDRYGFPHLTFQEYLTARHIAAQPDPDYIDLVMVHLHEAWWREVHLLVIGHLGSGSEGAARASKLLLHILHLYRPPWRLLRSVRLNRWVPEWLNTLMNQYEDNRILKGPVYVVAFAIVISPELLALTRTLFAARLNWQLERRLAWMLAREFLFATVGFADCAPLGTNAEVRHALVQSGQTLLLQIVRDPGRHEDGTRMPGWVAAGSLGQLGKATSTSSGQALEQVVSALVGALGDFDSDVRQAAASTLGLMEQTSTEVVDALIEALDDSYEEVQYTAAKSLKELGFGSLAVVREIFPPLNGESAWNVRSSVPLNLVEFEQGELEKIVPTLENFIFSVQEADTQSLGQVERVSDEIVSDLVGNLHDTDSSVRFAAAMSLEELGRINARAVSSLIAALGSLYSDVQVAAAFSLGQLGQVSDEVVSALVSVLVDDNSSVWFPAMYSLGQLKIEDETQLHRVLIALNRRLHDRDDDVRRAALTAIRRLLDGRQIPGYRWVPIRKRRERAKKRRILGYWVIGLAVLLLVAWVGAGVATYLRVDPFIERFVAYALALVALAAGVVQVSGWLRRPPWDR